MPESVMQIARPRKRSLRIAHTPSGICLGGLLHRLHQPPLPDVVAHELHVLAHRLVIQPADSVD